MLLRTLRAGPGQERELLKGLQDIATRMIRERRSDAVQICQYSDARDRVVWIEDRRAGTKSVPTLEEEIARACPQALAQGPISTQFELVDGFYRYPLPSCQVWSFEVSPLLDPGGSALGCFLDMSRAASAIPSVGGMSVYRTTNEPTGVLVFVALNDGTFPVDVFGSSTGIWPRKWRQLLVVWTMGRLSTASDPRLRAAPARYPRATFWARSMPVLAVGAGPEQGQS